MDGDYMIKITRSENPHSIICPLICLPDYLFNLHGQIFLESLEYASCPGLCCEHWEGCLMMSSLNFTFETRKKYNWEWGVRVTWVQERLMRKQQNPASQSEAP